jgi:hypothetical protein
MKDRAYQLPKPQFFREQISQAIANVDDSELLRTWEEFEYRFEVCRATKGTHIER